MDRESAHQEEQEELHEKSCFLCFSLLFKFRSCKYGTFLLQCFLPLPVFRYCKIVSEFCFFSIAIASILRSFIVCPKAVVLTH